MPSANQSSVQVRDHEYYHAKWNVKNAEREKTNEYLLPNCCASDTKLGSDTYLDHLNSPTRWAA